MSFRISKRDAGRFRDFLDTGGRKILLYHNDPDGVCSAALLLKFFPGFETIPRPGPRISDEFLGELVEKKPGLVLFLDTPVDQEERKIRRLQKETGCRIIIIDHHIYEKDLNSKGILHMNPRFRKSKAYIPCSAMVYSMLGGMGFDVGRLCWIASMGIIGDYEIEDSADILEECRDEYPYLLGKRPLDSKLSEGADLISYAVIVKGPKGAGESLKVLLKAVGFEDFFGNRRLQGWGKEMEREFDFIVKDAEKEEHTERGLDIYTIKTRFNVASLVATRFSEKYPDRIILVRKELKDGWKVCLRNQSGRVNLGRIVKKCVRGIGSGGGHERAAGVMTKDWEKFRKRFISSLSAS
jgi:single-stranded DNA-specific DHH superfamily exonuclease